MRLDLKLSPTQMAFCLSESRYVWLIGPEREGKSLYRGTMILMYDGTLRKVEDIRVGDIVMGPDSKPRTVRTLGRGHEDMFRIVPKRGEPWACNGSHLLALRRAPNGEKKNRKGWKRIGETVIISVNKYLTTSKTFKIQHNLFRVPVNFESKPVPLPPYWMGVWLGDGTHTSPEITTPEPEIEEYLQQTAVQYGLKLTVKGQQGANRCYMSGAIGRHKVFNPFTDYIHTSGLSTEKHIPHVYKANSVEARREILAGLIDTDGWVNRSGYQLIFKGERLAQDVAFIARSLGFYASVKPRKKSCKAWGIEGIYYHVMLSGDFTQIPMKVTRKKPIKRKLANNILTTGIREIVPLGIGEYFGFTLAEDPLFLLGDFTVTHNTFSGVSALFAHQQRCLPYLSNYPMRGAIIRDTHANIKRHTVESVNRDFPSVFTFHDDYHKMKTKGIEIDLFGMDDAGSVGRIQGGQYDIIWIEEPAPVIHSANAGISHDVFLASARRIAAGGKTPKRLQITMNPADKDHWTYEEAILNPLKNTEVLHIRPGENPYLSAEDRIARAEIFRNRPDLKARYDEGKFADVYEGIAITPEFGEMHIAKERLDPIPLAQHFRFWDGGLTPSCIIACLTGSGRFLILDSMMIENAGIKQLIDGKVKYLLATPRYKDVTKWRDLGDDSLKNREQANSDYSASTIINRELKTAYEGGIQAWDLRREALKDAMTKIVNGVPFFQVSPHVTEGEKCNWIRIGLSGGYQYKVNPSGQVVRDGPFKNSYSHPCDALSHGLAKLFFRPKEQTIRRDHQRDMARAKGYAVGV